MIKRVVTLMLVLMCTACDVRGRVLFIGDSNLALQAHIFISALWAGIGYGVIQPKPPAYLTTWIPVSGSGFKDSELWTSTLKSVGRAQTFDAVVLSMGVNDSGTGGCTTNMPARINAVINALPPNIPIIIVDVPYVGNPNYNVWCSYYINLELQRVKDINPRVLYINTNTVLNAVPISVRFSPDGVHYADGGAHAIAEAVRLKLETLRFTL